MTKQDFQEQQKADFQARYAFLKEAIISNHKYRKTLKRKN